MSKLAPSYPDEYGLHRMDLPTSLPNLNPVEDFGLCPRTASKIEQDVIKIKNKYIGCSIGIYDSLFLL
jgi:hypothetical protein